MVRTHKAGSEHGQLYEAENVLMIGETLSTCINNYQYIFGYAPHATITSMEALMAFTSHYYYCYWEPFIHPKLHRILQ